MDHRRGSDLSAKSEQRARAESAAAAERVRLFGETTSARLKEATGHTWIFFGPKLFVTKLVISGYGQLVVRLYARSRVRWIILKKHGAHGATETVTSVADGWIASDVIEAAPLVMQMAEAYL